MVCPEGPGALTTVASCIACLTSLRSESRNTLFELIFTTEANMQRKFSMDMQRKCSVDVQRRNVAWTCKIEPCTCNIVRSMDMQNRHALWACNHGHAA
jgi:hypothetical protein